MLRAAYPDQPSNRLDVLMAHLQIPRRSTGPVPHQTPKTVRLFTRLLAGGGRARRRSTLQQVRQIGGYRARVSLPRQEALFD